jgi:glycosyltransferase involved in cell wall biosynthesis
MNYIEIGNCLVSCQRDENYAWSLLEFMSTGKLVIATDVGGTSKILKDNYNGLLVKPNPTSLYQKMKYVIENYEKLKFIGNNACNSVNEKHSMKNLDKYEKLINCM